MENFSKIAKPLCDIICQAFNTLKDKLPLHLFRVKQVCPFVLYTDASGKGHGAVLYRKQDGVVRVISYAGRDLSKAKANYPTHKLEFLVNKWAVVDNSPTICMVVVMVVQFTLINKPIAYVLTTARLDATVHQWPAALAAYNLEIKYHSGHTNSNSDIVSHLPAEAIGKSEDLCVIDQQILNVIRME